MTAHEQARADGRDPFVVVGTVHGQRQQPAVSSPAEALAVMVGWLRLEHEQTIEDLDLAGILGALEDPIHVIVPMMVVDELDNGKRNHDGKKRGRARQALRIIDQTVKAGGVLRARDLVALQANSVVPVAGKITLEVVSDPPRHVRLTIPDDEIVDRALAVQALAGSPVTIVTFDTGMSLRAREADLPEIKLDPPPEPENGG